MKIDIKDAIALARKHHALCQENVEESPNWSAAQAEWSRARDRCSFIIDDLEAVQSGTAIEVVCERGTKKRG